MRKNASYVMKVSIDTFITHDILSLRPWNMKTKEGDAVHNLSLSKWRSLCLFLLNDIKYKHENGSAALVQGSRFRETWDVRFISIFLIEAATPIFDRLNETINDRQQ